MAKIKKLAKIALKAEKKLAKNAVKQSKKSDIKAENDPLSPRPQRNAD